MRSLVKIKPWLNSENSLSFTDEGKSCQSREFLTWQICLLTLFVKDKILAKFSVCREFQNYQDIGKSLQVSFHLSCRNGHFIKACTVCQDKSKKKKIWKRLFILHKGLTLKVRITTAADDKFCNIFPSFRKNKV